MDLPDEVFDQAHLARYTMNSADLEREIIGLFLQQLPATMDLIREAATPAEWKLATHTLKGAAAAIGAPRLRAIAIELERLPVGCDATVKSLRMALLEAEAQRFRETAAQTYP